MAEGLRTSPRPLCLRPRAWAGVISTRGANVQVERGPREGGASVQVRGGPGVRERRSEEGWSFGTQI